MLANASATASYEPPTDMPLSLAAKRVLAHAAEEARNLNNAHIGVEHLLLGLLNETDSPVPRFLRRYGIAHETARREIAGPTAAIS